MASPGYATPTTSTSPANNGTRRHRALVSLTPLIDVVFILLVFFMLASSFSEQQAIPLSTPATGEAERVLPASLIRVQHDGLDLNGEPLTLAELQLRAGRLSRVPGGRQFLVQPDPGIRLQQIVEVLDVLAQAGARYVSLIRK